MKFVETILGFIQLADVLSVSIRKCQKSLQFCGFLSSVYCILVTYGLHRKNKLTITKWWRSAGCFKKEEDLVANKVPLKVYCSEFQQY